MSSSVLAIAKDARTAAETLDLLLQKSGKGGKALLKDPLSKTSPGWHLCLPPHFNTSLDLRYTWRQKTKNKEVVQKWKEWSQGSCFCFNEGAIIYDRDVTGLETWGDKLNAIGFYVVIGPSRPVSLQSASVISNEASDFTNRDPGSVNFKIYIPTSDHSSVIAEEHTITQDHFVRYAISGQL